MKQNRRAQCFRFIFKLSPDRFVEMLLWGLFNCVLSFLGVWSTRRVVSLVSGGFNKSYFCALAIYGSALIISALYSVYYKRYKVQFHVIPAFEQRIRSRLFWKGRRISNEVYEDASSSNRMRLADGARQNMFRYVEIWVSILMAILNALVVTVYVSSFDVWLLLLLPFSIIPPCLNLLYQSNLWRRYHEAVEQCRKEEGEYLKGLIDEVACKESRMTYASDLLSLKWSESRRRRDSIENEKSRKTTLLQILLIPVDFIGSFGGYLVSIVLLFLGKIDYSACAAAIAAYASIMSALDSLVSMIGYEGQYWKMIQPFFDYMDTPERSGSQEDVSFQHEIRLDHVSFKYPNQKTSALENISFTIKKGEVIAIVGENGAGKTTLANVVLGLFLPSSGVVYYDGRNIEEASESRLHRMQSVVSQSLVRYKMSVRDNIAIADFKKVDEEGMAQKHRAFLEDSHVSLDTMLGKEFGGQDLSGGQWQQLACARGFYKDSDFVVLDEATSAIDPLKEKAMYDSFRCGLEGRTGIIVTHRLGAVSLADRIVVLQHGRVVQEGTHRELLNEDGVYVQLWNAQAKVFADEKCNI